MKMTGKDILTKYMQLWWRRWGWLQGILAIYKALHGNFIPVLALQITITPGPGSLTNQYKGLPTSSQHLVNCNLGNLADRPSKEEQAITANAADSKAH